MRRAIPSWQPPTPTPARSAASWARSLSQRKPKSPRGEAPRQCACRAKRLIVAIEADDAMMPKVRERARRAEADAIVAMGVEPDARLTDTARDEPGLGRTNHAHRDVGVAARQVLVAVGHREFNRDARMLRSETRQGSTGALRIRRSRSPLRERRRDRAPLPMTPSAKARRPPPPSPRRAEQAQARPGSASRPRGERVKSVRPSASSSASICRPTVGWVRPSRRAAPDRLPSRTTSKKVRSSSQEVRGVPYENV